MSLIKNEEITHLLKMEKFGQVGQRFSHGVMDILSINLINQLYDRHKSKVGVQFIDAVLQELNITIDLKSEELAKFPKNKPFILVANHPLGALDGLILLKILLTVHPEAKIMANFLLCKIEPLKDYFIPVNPFESRKEIKSSFSGIKSAISHVDQGMPLGIFPAGEVSTLSHRWFGNVRDKQWDLSVIKMIKKMNVTVIPLYFHVRNSPLFYLLAGLNQNLRTARLPGEVFNAKNKVVKIKLGHPITTEQQVNCSSPEELRKMLLTRTYMLRSAFLAQNPRYLDIHNFRQSVHKIPIANRPPFEIIEKELVAIHAKKIMSSGDYDLYFTKLDKSPCLLKLIGIEREHTFRKVGEGSQKSMDIDGHDLEYHHLILWDRLKQQLVGAYRLGFGKELIQRGYGFDKLYTSSLFKMDDELKPFLSKCLEIGRSFITAEYQQKPTPLFILWKGLAKIAIENPEYKYFLGAASISNCYQKLSKSCLVYYLIHYHLAYSLAKFIEPNQPFAPKLGKDQKYFLLHLGKNHLKEIDNLIAEIEPNGEKMPILIKKYLSQNAKVLAINVDQNFSNSIDVLLYFSFEDIDKKFIVTRQE
jgi:putative hemolysin